MSALYGNIIGRRGPGATRLSDRTITAAVRSWDGSVTVTMMKADKDAAPMVEIQVSEGSKVGGRTVWRGPLASLMLQGLLRPEPEPEDEPSLDAEDGLPLCARAMGCLCAAHAKGRPATGPCDANESVIP